ncbi:PEP-CTERM sorting domain-containing protein [Paucibacter sp. Y2R2-4]|uniref:PEP-CTERM sorting domain-containing protein n=1 Tax=Paucibacter sp. Y2R2-4 TaxID=2893553 RepID=UPI0021E4F4D5|nr:PEP-CTERM sorting domain-containing protein [Paucibacter sp. Y2R2-4]MCV2350429.1 PEP-CTERM sorting domain-containing protein [Paucibacter sp. Y2R2-4]
MTPTQVCLAALLSCAALNAQAAASLQFGASAENQATQQFVYNFPDSVTSGNFSSQGPISAVAGGVAATLNVWADPSTGMFKSITQVQMSGFTEQTNIADAYTRLDMSDRLRFEGPGDHVAVKWTLNYDTVFAGLGFEAFARVGGLSHFMQANSFRDLSLSYEVANPTYDPGATCTNLGSDGMYCPPETQQFITQRENLSKYLFREVALGGPDGIYTNGNEDNGRYTGSLELSLLLPTRTDIQLSYTAYNSVRCFHLANCSLSSDASHSDYLGLQVADGASFSSDSGYQYLGVAAAVPEPASALLASLGLIGLLGWTRLQKRG